jgi:hypothetical protein
MIRHKTSTNWASCVHFSGIPSRKPIHQAHLCV